MCNDCPVGQVGIAGCSGRDRNNMPQCVECESTCEAGQYITVPCQPGQPLVSCGYCTQQCGAGFYFAGPCSGRNMYQDVDCRACRTCADGEYISKQCPGGNSLQNIMDVRECSRCRSSCDAGFYMNSPCNGKTTLDTVRCMRCSSYCPPGQYMHSPCNGTAYSADSNDCRLCTPCSPGQFISGGACINGTATSSGQRYCSSCSVSSCKPGEYILEGSRCTGMDVKDTHACRKCEPCPRGSFISKPCSGKDFASNAVQGRQCSACRACPYGYYRAGCLGNSTSDDTQCIPCTNCSKGQYISSGVCDGTTFSPPGTLSCTSCQPCRQGQYHSSGCTGSESSAATHTCSDCTELCQQGSYVAAGCKGDSASFQDKPSSCVLCSRWCSIGYYAASSPCTGRTFTAANPVCERCKCPGGRKIKVECTSGLQNHECEGGYVGPDHVSKKSTTSSLLYVSTPRALATASSVIMQTSETIPPPETTPSLQLGSDDNTLMLAGIGGGIASLALVVGAYLWFHNG